MSHLRHEHDGRTYDGDKVTMTEFEARRDAPDYVIDALQDWLDKSRGVDLYKHFYDKVRYWVHGDEMDEIGTTIHRATETYDVANTPASVRIRTWLLDYAWLGTEEEQVREVECIMHHEAPNLPHLEARVEQLLAQRSGERSIQEDVDEAVGIALSTLYECHDAPHLPTCPRATPFTVKE